MSLYDAMGHACCKTKSQCSQSLCYRLCSMWGFKLISWGGSSGHKLIFLLVSFLWGKQMCPKRRKGRRRCSYRDRVRRRGRGGEIRKENWRGEKEREAGKEGDTSALCKALLQETSFFFENGPLRAPPLISLATLEPTQVSREARRFIQDHMHC